MADYDVAMTRLKKTVYKQRIRLKDFFVDFDRLNTGFVHSNHFMSALSMAGVDKHLSKAECQAITDHYVVPRTPTLEMCDHRTFLHDVDLIFTVAHLEKDPLVEVPVEPAELLDRTRYLKSSRILGENDEAAVQTVINRLSDIAFKRGQPVKAFFDDAAENDNSAKMFGHVTIPQFRQVLSTKLDWRLSEEESALLVQKFHNEDKPEFVNYICFSNVVDPPERYMSNC